MGRNGLGPSVDAVLADLIAGKDPVELVSEDPVDYANRGAINFKLGCPAHAWGLSLAGAERPRGRSAITPICRPDTPTASLFIARTRPS